MSRSPSEVPHRDEVWETAMNSSDSDAAALAERAREICLALLTARPRSRSELARALSRRGIPAEVGESVLDRLGVAGLVDDAVFAESAVHAGHTHRGLGRRALAAELRRKGVPDGVAREAVAMVQPQDEERRARELVRRKLAATTSRDPATTARRLAGMLARKGYSEGLVLRVLRDELGPNGWLPDAEPGLD
jgi:regulatory protein